MKKYISFLLSFAMLFSVLSLFNLSVSADFADVTSMDGYENLCLTYTWNPDRSDNGRHTADDLMPYVAYYDKNRQIKDFFFDSYLFIPCQKAGPSGGSLQFWPTTPTKAIDWTSYVEDTFYNDRNVEALDIAFGRAKEALNAPDKKAGVFFTILYPGMPSGADFGSLGGRALDFSKMEDRKAAIKWIIDEQVRLFTVGNYKNLDLIGFYWMEEYIEDETDKELFKYASDYLHSLGLKFLWIPCYRATGYADWKDYGFDIACRQPNRYWYDNTTKSRIETCVDTCKANGMSVEIEVDQEALSNPEYYNRYLDYLEVCMQKGAMDSIKVYYQSGKEGAYYAASRSTNKRARTVYDLTYKYAKGTLTQADIDEFRDENNLIVPPFVLSEDVDWISIGKKYTATQPYSDGSNAPYQQNDGTELTDGVIATSDLGTDWHAFHSSRLDADKRMNVTIDLGEIRDDLTDFLIQFSHIQLNGIGDPANNIRVYISENGTDYKLIGKPELEYYEYTVYVHHKTVPLTARYVKFSFVNSEGENFLFCGEAAVGVSDDWEGRYNPDDDENLDTPVNNTNVALGKKYTGADVSPVGANYSANLTDGQASDAIAYDSNWFAFYYNKNATAENINAPKGVGEIVIDLLEVYDGINIVKIHVWNHNKYGVAAAKSITAFFSEDGVNYGEGVAITVPESEAPAWAKAKIDNVSARYVKIRIETQDTWTFLNEIEVYADPDYVPGIPTGPDVSGYDNVALNKKYTGANVSSVGANYSAKLTDGKASDEQKLGSDWFAYYYNKNATADKINAPKGIGEIVIDLAEVCHGIKVIRVHTWNYNNSGISAAKSITAYFSKDGVNYGEGVDIPGYDVDEPSWIFAEIDNATARYVKIRVETQGTWTFLNEIEVYADPDYVPEISVDTEGYENVALNKNYTGADVTSVSSYFANLTDGQAGSKWFAFYYNKDASAEDVNAPNGIGEIVIDLAEVYDEIKVVRVHTWNCNNSGIAAAKRVTAYFSKDGVNYGRGVNIPVATVDEPSWIAAGIDNATARYVKIRVETQDTWTFLNEIEVYAASDYVPEAPDVSEPDGTLGNVDADGDVDAADYVLVKRAVLKTYNLTEEQFKVADIDGDNDVDATDYVLVKRIVLGTYKVK